MNDKEARINARRLNWFPAFGGGRHAQYTKRFWITETATKLILLQPLNASGVPYGDNRGMVVCESVVDAIKKAEATP